MNCEKDPFSFFNKNRLFCLVPNRNVQEGAHEKPQGIKKDLRCLSNPFVISDFVSKQDKHLSKAPHTVEDISHATRFKKQILISHLNFQHL